MDSLLVVLTKLSLITAFVVVGIVVWASYRLSDVLSKGRFHGSAIAIILGLLLAYLGGLITGGEKGLADIAVFTGIGVLGGAMFRDFAIVATAFGADLEDFKKSGSVGMLSIVLGVVRMALTTRSG